MAAPKRTKAQREADLERIADYIAMRWTERQMAEALMLSQGTIHRDIEEIERRHVARTMEKLERHKARLILGLDKTVRELWEAWFSSKGLQIRLREVQKRGETPELNPTMLPDGVTTVFTDGFETTQQIKQSHYSPGNPRYMEQLIAAYKEIGAILGVYAARELNVNIKQYVEAEAKRAGLDPEALMAEIEEAAEAAWNQQAGQAG